MKAKLEQNQQRMERLRNAKSRTIGVSTFSSFFLMQAYLSEYSIHCFVAFKLDVDSLDAMVAEKEQKKAAEREAEAAEGMHISLCRLKNSNAHG
jgi:hypothetical protein